MEGSLLDMCSSVWVSTSVGKLLDNQQCCEQCCADSVQSKNRLKDPGLDVVEMHFQLRQLFILKARHFNYTGAESFAQLPLVTVATQTFSFRKGHNAVYNDDWQINHLKFLVIFKTIGP